MSFVLIEDSNDKMGKGIQYPSNCGIGRRLKLWFEIDQSILKHRTCAVWTDSIHLIRWFDNNIEYT